jgi:hypothetical protein
MDAFSGTPPTPPYSIPPSAAAPSIAPPPNAANPSDAGNPAAVARALFVPPRPTLHTGAAAAQVPAEGFRSIENKKFSTMTNKNKPRSDLRDAKQRAREIRST